MAAPHIDIASKEFKDYVATLNPDLGVKILQNIL